MNKIIKVMIVTLMFVLTFVFNVNAQTNIRCIDQLIIDGSNSLEINDEEINVDVTTGKVTCEYSIYNPLETTIKVTAKYPVRYYESHEYSDTNISKFSAYVDNENVGSYQIESDKYEIRNYCAFDFVVNSKETKKIKITYNTNFIQNNDYSINVGCYRTGITNFNGTIKHSKIIFDFNELTKYYVITPDDNSTYKKVENKYVWEASDYKPKENLMLVMKPKLLTSKTINVSYYSNTNGLKDKKILIDVDSNYTKTEIENATVINAAKLLEIKLKESGAEVAISNDIENLEKEIKKEATFDYVITLICKTSLDPNVITKEIFIEPLKRGNEEKYIESQKIATYIQNAGLSGISEYFTYLKDKKIAGSNVLRYVGSLDVSKTEYSNVPRVIISLGYISDPNKTYDAYDGIIEKTRLGLVIMNESDTEDDSNEYVITKNNSKLTNTSKNFFAKIKSKIVKFFKYNIVTIIGSILVGIGIAIVLFSILTNHYDKKMKISYEDIKRKEKELESKMSIIEKEKIESEKHKETLKEIIKDRLNLIKDKNNKYEYIDPHQGKIGAAYTDEEILNNYKNENENVNDNEIQNNIKNNDENIIEEKISFKNKFMKINNKNNSSYNYSDEIKKLTTDMKNNISIKFNSNINTDFNSNVNLVKDVNDNDLIFDDIKKQEKEAFKEKKENMFFILANKARENSKKYGEKQLNSFEKLNKKEAKKILRKIKIKGIGK